MCRLRLVLCSTSMLDNTNEARQTAESMSDLFASPSLLLANLESTQTIYNTQLKVSSCITQQKVEKSRMGRLSAIS